MKSKLFSLAGILAIMLVLGLTVTGCASLFGGSAPSTFVRGQAGTTTIMLRPGLDFDQAYREVSFILLQKNFQTETLQPEAGYIRTNWRVWTTARGQINDRYRVRISVTFNPSRTQVTLNVEGQWQDGSGNWLPGNDTAISEDLRTELMMAVGN